ncbi:MAG: hypothetical protein IT435_10650 [Phycisphaerales bacterium]|nr:hypothetical protein [Phycisphaerales bacterium]
MTSPAAQNATDRLFDTWPYIAGLILLAVIGGIAILLIRRNLLTKPDALANESLMESLRRLRDTGEMTHKEYESTIRAMAVRIAAKPAKPTDPAQALLASSGIAPPPQPRLSQQPPTPPKPPAPKPDDDGFPPLIELPPES